MQHEKSKKPMYIMHNLNQGQEVGISDTKSLKTTKLSKSVSLLCTNSSAMSLSSRLSIVFVGAEQHDVVEVTLKHYAPKVGL